MSAQETLNEEEYYLNPKNTGRALIFLFKDEEKGFQEDEEQLINTVKRHLKYDTEIYRDCTSTDIETKLQEVAEDNTPKNSLVVVISTYGDYLIPECKKECNSPCDKHNERKEVLHVGGNTQIAIDDLWKPFTGDLCPALLGKPKLFFITACRGKEKPEAPNTESSDTADFIDGTSKQRIPNYADFLIARWSPWDFSSYYGPARSRPGFLKALCEVLQNSTDTDDIHTILTKVNYLVTESDEVPDQVPEIKYTLTKDLKLKSRVA